MLTFGAAVAGTYTPLLPVRVLPALVVVPAIGLLLVQAAVDDVHHSLWAVYFVIVASSAIVTYASSVWFLGVLWELADSRDTQAQLAVAEERLRFSRDLHDVLGRNLALMAVNSELAAELARRQDPGAVEHMLAVQQVAQDSVRELREVVSGYRAAALDVELAGAQSLLRATGIDVRLSGDGRELAMAAQAALGWVVREATTNILRHSNPTRVTIELTTDDDCRRAADPQRRRAPGRRARRPRPGRAAREAGRRRRVAGDRSPARQRFCALGTRAARRGGGPVIRLLLADDENLIRTALAALLTMQDDLVVVAEAASGNEALAMARLHQPDIAVLDLQMPLLDGISVTEALRLELPACGCIIVTSHALPGHLKRALAAGARGFLPKTVSGQVLADVIRTVHGGGRYVDPELAAEAISAGDNPLTPREAHVLELAADGLPADEIAVRAGLSVGTVRNYLSAAAVKLGAANRHEAVHLARARGWI